LPSAEKIVEKNFLLHHKDIMADLDKAETDFSAKTFFKAGTDVADMVVKAMGPVVASTSEQLTVSDPSPFPTEIIVNWFAGIFYEFIELNNLPEIKTCYKAAMADYPNLKDAVTDLFAGDDKDAVAAISKFAASFNTVITTCK